MTGEVVTTYRKSVADTMSFHEWVALCPGIAKDPNTVEPLQLWIDRARAYWQKRIAKFAPETFAYQSADYALHLLRELEADRIASFSFHAHR